MDESVERSGPFAGHHDFAGRRRRADVLAEEQTACRSDAGKLCAEHLGKPPQMNACLRDNKAKLSDSCRKVVESRGG